MRTFTACVLALFLMAGCAHARQERAAELTVEQVAELLPPKLTDAEGWARDLMLALTTNALPVDYPHTCSVIAIAEQESGLQANPAVPGLPGIARRALTEKARSLGVLGPVVLKKLLEGKAPGTAKTFEQRIDTLKTEADLDRLFRDILADHQRRSPALYAAANFTATLFSSGSFEDRNPVTTAGSMQVSVRFAEDRAKALKRDVQRVRDALYTREGGLLYGSARLWSFDAAYGNEMIYRFADYNAGPYSSRNAEFQAELSSLSGQTLALDGDLLAYDADGDVKTAETQTMRVLKEVLADHAKVMSPGTAMAERDARKEKSDEFERTGSWLLVKRVFEEKTKAAAPYARLPDVTLVSVKLGQKRTTAWFAKSVQRRYEACLARAK